MLRTAPDMGALLKRALHHRPQDGMIRSRRLTLRPLRPADAGRVAELAGDWEVASMTARIPYPYTEGMARQWIETIEPDEFVCAIEHDGEFIGLCGYLPDNDGSAELGYWLGKPYWGKGFATEAAQALIRYCFRVAKIRRLTSGHFVENPASQRVIAKLGFHEIESSPCWCEARKVMVDARRYEMYKPNFWRGMSWSKGRQQQNSVQHG